MTAKRSKVLQYTVRRPGNVSWSEHATKKAAIKECEIANRVCCPGHHVYADHVDGDVTGPYDMEAIIRGTEEDRLAYRYAVADQGYDGTFDAWCVMPIAQREDFEAGASGGDNSREILPAFRLIYIATDAWQKTIKSSHSLQDIADEYMPTDTQLEDGAWLLVRDEVTRKEITVGER